MPQITQRIQTKSHCPFRQWLPFSVISLRPSSGTAIIPTKTSERGVERWQTTNTDFNTEQGQDCTKRILRFVLKITLYHVGQIRDLRI